MQLSTAKQKLLAGQPAYGYSLGLGSPLVAELLARSGIDFLLWRRSTAPGATTAPSRP